MPSVSKSKLYAELSAQLPQYSKKTIELIGNHLFQQLTWHLTQHHPVAITNLGRFDVIYKRPNPYFDIKQQMVIQSQPHHKVQFNACPTLKENLHYNAGKSVS